MSVNRNRVSSAVACALAAARAVEALELWLPELSETDLTKVKHSLCNRLEWRALCFLEQAIANTEGG